MSTRFKIIGGWVILVCACIAWISLHGRVTSNLSAFLPEGANPAQRAVVRELRNGMQTRLLLLSLGGADSQKLATASRQLATAMRASTRFAAVFNGQFDAVSSALSPAVLKKNVLYRYRFLLDPGTVPAAFRVAQLRQRFTSVLDLLGSAAGPLYQPLIPADPGLRYLHLLGKLAPASGPRRLHGVWFDTKGRSALLVAEIRGAGFDINAQQRAIGFIHRWLHQHDAGLQAEISGPGSFAVASRSMIKHEITWLSIAASAALLILLGILFRHPRPVLLVGLPVASGVLLATTGVLVVFGYIHGITLAFGTTVLGVALDYPLHLLIHSPREGGARKAIGEIWRTMLLGAVTTAVGYLAMLMAGIPGLAQLGLFTILGLAGAVLTTRWLLPELLGDWYIDLPGRVARWQNAVHHRWLAVPGIFLLILASLGVLVMHSGNIWSSDLTRLSPLPSAQLALDQKLRQEFRLPALNELLIVEKQRKQAVLESLERLTPALKKLKKQGSIGSFELPTGLLPSDAMQRRRQEAIPPKAILQKRVDSALKGLPFRPGTFSPYVQDLVASRQLPLLTQDMLAESPAGLRLGAILQQDDKGWTASVPLYHVAAPAAVKQFVQEDGVYFVDLHATIASILAAYRHRTMLLFLVGSGFTLVLLAVSLGSLLEAIRVAAAPYAAVLVTAAVFVTAGIPLTLFHLIAMMLVIGLGLDYSLFFRRAQPAAETARTLLALLACTGSTVLVFGLLAVSSSPLLSGIGITVSAGALLSFVFAWWLVPRQTTIQLSG